MTCFKIIVSTFFVLQILIPAVVEADKHVCLASNDESSDPTFTHHAACTMIGDIYGTIYLRQGTSGLEIRYKLGGLSGEMEHENDVHEFGDLFMSTTADLCEETGDFYNPTDKSYNGTGGDRPIGKLRHICADGTGMANGVIVDDIAMLYGNNSIVGRSIVVHEAEDEHEEGEEDDHDHDHEILGCCVIGISGMWEPDEIEASEPFKVGNDTESESESVSGVNKKGTTWVTYAFGFYFWKIFQ